MNFSLLSLIYIYIYEGHESNCSHYAVVIMLARDAASGN
jgi:hypothetical protein